MTINTAKVLNRRQLHFASPQDILDDAERLDPAATKALGNWSGGQIFSHVAIVMNDSIDGTALRFSWVLRMLGRLLKKRILSKGMSPGFQLKGPAVAILVPPAATSWETGLKNLRQAIIRLQTENKREPSPFLGPMSREEWDQLHCRHAELHFSFLSPQSESKDPR